MIDYSYMELIPASLIPRFAVFSIKLTYVRVVLAFDQTNFLEILSRDYTSPENSSYGFLPLPNPTHFHTVCYVCFAMLLVIEYFIKSKTCNIVNY